MITIITDGNILQFTSNLFPTARESCSVVNCVPGVDTLDMITITTDGNIIQTTSNLFPTTRVFCFVVNCVPGVYTPDILTITQEGATFSAVKQIGNSFIPKGAETIKGELDKDGFKEVYQYIGVLAMDGTYEWANCKWKIRENGNETDLDCGERIKATLTRK